MILVAGPPCGGKTTYVQQHALATDTILDFDDIVERLTGDRYTRTPATIAAARAEWKRCLPDADWVIYSAPRSSQRASLRKQYGANAIVVTASIDECLRRARASRPASWQELIRQWFADWQPSANDHLVDTGC